MIQEEILDLFVKKQKTLSLAESCTGGHVSSLLTKVPNASSYFLGAQIAYSNSWKESSLSVPKEMIEIYGAVSKETALEMARNVLCISGSNVSAAITGIAGPSGGSEEKPVGTVWFALYFDNGHHTVWKHFFKGSREVIIVSAADHLLHRLKDAFQREYLIFLCDS